MRGKSAEVGFRLDGIINSIRELPAEVAERVFGRIKFLARLKTYQESLPQDGRIAHDELKCANDIRVATYPTVTGEKIVLRLFNSATAKALGELSLAAAAKTELDKFLRQTSGLLLLTGPAGAARPPPFTPACGIWPKPADATSSRGRPGGADCSRHHANGDQRSRRPGFCAGRAASAAAGPAGAHYR